MNVQSVSIVLENIGGYTWSGLQTTSLLFTMCDPIIPEMIAQIMPPPIDRTLNIAAAMSLF